MRCRIILLGLLLINIAGCAAEFSCKETIDGVRCKNLRAVYDEKVLTATEVYNKKVIAPTEEAEKQNSPETEKERIVRSLNNDGSRPIRIPPVVLRIWTAPWEDSDGDLHKPGYIYCEINQKRGRWLFGESSIGGSTVPVLTSVNNGNSSEGQKDSKSKKETRNTKQTESRGYYGDKPDPNMPKLKLSK